MDSQTDSKLKRGRNKYNQKFFLILCHLGLQRKLV